MSISLYSAASGMEAQQTSLNVISNNIANVSTHGFKKSKVEFQDMFYQAPKTVGAEAGGNVLPTGIQIGSGTQVVSTAKVFTQGQVVSTGERLDIAIIGDGFLKLQDANGEQVYTRAGALKTGPDGKVLSSNGLEVIGFPPVPVGSVDINISEGGIVTFIDAESKEIGKGNIALTRFNNPSGLAAKGGNLYAETDASGAAQEGVPGQAGFGSIQQRFLETSNVNIVEEMVNMIMAQRAYELNSRSIQTSDSIMQQVAQLKR